MARLYATNKWNHRTRSVLDRPNSSDLPRDLGATLVLCVSTSRVLLSVHSADPLGAIVVISECTCRRLSDKANQRSCRSSLCMDVLPPAGMEPLSRSLKALF